MLKLADFLLKLPKNDMIFFTPRLYNHGSAHNHFKFVEKLKEVIHNVNHYSKYPSDSFNYVEDACNLPIDLPKASHCTAVIPAKLQQDSNEYHCKTEKCKKLYFGQKSMFNASWPPKMCFRPKPSPKFEPRRQFVHKNNKEKSNSTLLTPGARLCLTSKLRRFSGNDFDVLENNNDALVTQLSFNKVYYGHTSNTQKQLTRYFSMMPVKNIFDFNMRPRAKNSANIKSFNIIQKVSGFFSRLLSKNKFKPGAKCYPTIGMSDESKRTHSSFVSDKKAPSCNLLRRNSVGQNVLNGKNQFALPRACFSTDKCPSSEQIKDIFEEVPQALRKLDDSENEELEEYFECYETKKYYKYHEYSFYDLMEHMASDRQPQPSSKSSKCGCPPGCDCEKCTK